MADNSLVALTDSDNEVQAPQTQERTTASSVSPTRDIPEPLFYTSGEARVIRARRRGAGSSRADPYSNYTGNPTIRMFRPPLARRWEWLPTTLNTWRSEEEIQVPADPMDTSPYTQEPIHHTVPVLAARLHRHEQRLEDLEREQHMMTTYLLRQAHDRMAQLQREFEDMNHTLDMVHQQVIDDRGTSDLLQARIEECEQHSQEAEEYTRVLEQRLILAEDSARQTSRLAEIINRLVTLMSRVNLRD